jgi:hypothetical protein
MKNTVNNEFVEICKEIASQNKSIDEWAEIESDDMFQTKNYVGGFDATEMEFCFSVYINQKEYWFQVSLKDIHDILVGKLKEYDIREPEN